MTTAEPIVAQNVATNFVLQIQMNVCELYSANCSPWLSLLLLILSQHILVDLVNEVIIL